MNKETIKAIIKEYESDKENKGFVSIIMHDGTRFGQMQAFRDPLSNFELYNDETLLVEFSKQTWYISINAIDMVLFRPKFLL